MLPESNVTEKRSRPPVPITVGDYRAGGAQKESPGKESAYQGSKVVAAASVMGRCTINDGFIIAAPCRFVNRFLCIFIETRKLSIRKGFRRVGKS